MIDSSTFKSKLPLLEAAAKRAAKAKHQLYVMSFCWRCGFTHSNSPRCVECQPYLKRMESYVRQYSNS